MSTNDERLRAMYLAGTVSIPPKFPELAIISFAVVNKRFIVEATQQLSPKLTIKRTFFAVDVSSIFKPSNENVVDLRKGTFYEADELEAFVTERVKGRKSAFKGIVYVREHAQSSLEMTAGMTAAESAEFYPPLPTDRSVNHYDMNPAGTAWQLPPGCHW